MPDNKKSLEVLTSSLDLNQEKLADNEKNERVQEIVDTQNNKDIDNKINEIETASDTLVTNEQMKKELWAHKVEAEMSAREKIKEKWGETAERAKRNWWLIVWWVGSFLGIRRLWKKIKWNETTETSNSTNSTETKDSKGNTVINVDATPKKNWFQRNWGWLVWGAWVAGAWVYFKDKLHKIPVIGTWLDKLFNAPEVSFEDSFTNFKSDIKSGEVEKHLAVNPGISYEKVDEKTMKLKSYNKEILIDIEKRTVQGMEDVVFPNFKELLHAANLINFSWAAFQWICANTVPFKLTSLGWDIEVKLLDSWDKELVSGAGIPIGKIAWWTVGVLTTILWAVYGWWVPWGAAWAGIWIAAVWWWHLMDQSDALSQYCPTLNNDANKEKFRARLNKIPNLTQWNQEKKPDNTSPLHPALNKVIDEITATATDSDFENQGNARQLDAVQDSKDKNKYRIVSWSQETCITLKNNQVVIDWLDVLLPINEWIRIANLTNKIKRENARQWSSKQPFHRRWTLESAWFPWLYMSTNEFNDNWTKWRRIIKKETIEKKYPTLYDNKDKYIDYLHTLKDENNNPLWIA